MSEFFQNLPPYIQALIAGIITWLLTALGAAAVFIFKRVNDKILNSMQGFAAGIMIAASFWSLLQPAINYGEGTSL
ncbi:ZIP family metal transporter, partial [Staphylococcus aureus]